MRRDSSYHFFRNLSIFLRIMLANAQIEPVVYCSLNSSRPFTRRSLLYERSSAADCILFFRYRQDRNHSTMLIENFSSYLVNHVFGRQRNLVQNG